MIIGVDFMTRHIVKTQVRARTIILDKDDAGSQLVIAGCGAITTELPKHRLTERNRFYVTDYFYCFEIFQDGKFIPYWVRTNDNGADIYTKAVPPQIMKRLRPGQTGYSDGPLPAVDMTITPKTPTKATPTVSTATATHVFGWEGVKRN